MIWDMPMTSIYKRLKKDCKEANTRIHDGCKSSSRANEYSSRGWKKFYAWVIWKVNPEVSAERVGEWLDGTAQCAYHSRSKAEKLRIEDFEFKAETNRLLDKYLAIKNS